MSQPHQSARQPVYRLYGTQREWNQTARVLILFGLVGGFLLGAGLVGLAWLMTWAAHSV